ncbi:MAG: M23 family metallopeptidase [Saprospiraceae bacterium]|nr:M23 family metallopeptidase [Saprospiraceae bacterium]
MRWICSLGILFFLLSSFEHGSEKYPQDYFRSPVNFPILLSGTFGELRPNHFHAGIDIKSSNGKTGDDLVAVAKGTISRIKVQSAGYGNVLYMNHPNGYTSVYAHLKEFPKEIADYVRKFQYQKKKFEVNIYPPAGTFNFEQGEKIGTLGTSGRSYGPHLHFEIRDTKTEKPINPQLFGIGKEDTMAPKFHQIRWYGLNDKKETLHEGSYDLIKDGNNYRIKGDTISLGAWRAGLAIKAYDHTNGSPNWNGIYSLEVKQDGKKIYGFTMESFAFHETRYINAHLDYKERVENKSYYHRCFRLPGNKLSIYEDAVKEGIVPLYKDKASQIEMVAKDVAGNTARLEFWVKRSEVPDPPSNTFQYVFPFEEENYASGDGWKLQMRRGTLYEDLYWKYSSEKAPEMGYSPVHIFHNGFTPIHKSYELLIQPDHLPDHLKEKALIASRDSKGNWSSAGGKWKGEYLVTKVRSLGAYSVMTDQQKPKISPIKFKKDMQGYTRMSFKVTDDMDAAKEINSFGYNATIDGEWALFEYDAKNDLLTHRFVPEEFGKGEHVVKLVVTDAVGNKSVFQEVFNR